MKKVGSSRKGFTLIEMLIVIGIIGILAVGLGRLILGAPQKARDSQRKTAMAQIVQAIEAYNVDNGAYPGNNTTGEALCINSTDADTAIETALKSYFPAGNIPSDAGTPIKIDGTNVCDFVYVRLKKDPAVSANYVIYSQAENDTASDTVTYPAAPLATDTPTAYAGTGQALYYVVQ